LRFRVDAVDLGIKVGVTGKGGVPRRPSRLKPLPRRRRAAFTVPAVLIGRHLP
jgi:hypothetical protein